MIPKELEHQPNYKTRSRDTVNSALNRGNTCYCKLKDGRLMKILRAKGEHWVLEGYPQGVHYNEALYVVVIITQAFSKNESESNLQQSQEY